MNQTVVTVGFEIPGFQEVSLDLESKSSLLDWDTAIVVPDISSFHQYSIETYRGKTMLSDDGSFRLKESLTHWRREITAAMEAGKVIVVLLADVEEVYVATGQKEYSGTGRNRQATRIVSEINNYAMLPVVVSPVNSMGSMMAIDPKATFLSEYWDSFGAESTYRIMIDNPKLSPVVRTKSGNRVVGAYLQDARSNGAIICLPYIEFDRESFVYVKDKKQYWSKKAIAFGNRFISSVVKLVQVIKAQSERTPPPSWVDGTLFELESEKSTRQELLELETELQRIGASIQAAKERLEEEVAIKDLLFEKGKPLEKAIISALRILGFSANSFKQSDSEFDVVFESSEGRLLAEAEGKDTKQVNVDKLRQLEMNINEDYQREETSTMAKGVLIGNAFRLSPPAGRRSFFTEKCMIAARRSSTALLRSTDLFSAAREYLNNKQEDFATKFRRSLLETIGLVSLDIEPAQPQTDQVKEGK